MLLTTHNHASRLTVMRDSFDTSVDAVVAAQQYVETSRVVAPLSSRPRTPALSPPMDLSCGKLSRVNGANIDCGTPGVSHEDPSLSLPIEPDKPCEKFGPPCSTYEQIQPDRHWNLSLVLAWLLAITLIFYSLCYRHPRFLRSTYFRFQRLLDRPLCGSRTSFSCWI